MSFKSGRGWFKNKNRNWEIKLPIPVFFIPVIVLAAESYFPRLIEGYKLPVSIVPYTC
jgi:hypothetical protein